MVTITNKGDIVISSEDMGKELGTLVGVAEELVRRFKDTAPSKELELREREIKLGEDRLAFDKICKKAELMQAIIALSVAKVRYSEYSRLDNIFEELE